MFVPGDRQRALPPVRADGLDSMPRRANGADASDAKPTEHGGPLDLCLVARREGKEQLIIFASGQCQRHRVECASCRIGTAGGRYGKRAKIKLRSDMAFFADMAEIAGQTV